MPQTLTIPFYAFKLHLQDNDPILVPLSDANALFFKTSITQLSKKYQEKFQLKLLDRGNYQRILDELQRTTFKKGSFTIGFPASKDGISYPAFELEFDYYYKSFEEYYWGLIPVLGLEALSENEEELEERLQEVVKVDFSSKKRLSHVQYILSSLWFKDLKLESANMQLKFYSPIELQTLKKEQSQQLLPKVATPLNLKAQAAFGREAELTQMDRVLSSSFSKNILLVGATGTGKTALVWELARRRNLSGHKNKIWETTASVLIKELTKDTGWQDNMSLLVKELTNLGDFLFIRNISELFEVGQYEGNEVSLAEYIRSNLGRGELSLISECTPEERARIEVRNPNYLALFQIIQLEEPQENLEEIILKKIDQIAGSSNVSFEKGAIEEIIRLNKRFSPYAGMPGKPIRFLESVLLANSPIITQKKGTSGTIDPPQKVMVDRRKVLQHFSDDSGLPLFMIDPAESMDIELIKQKFNSNVFGQNLAVNTVVDLLAAVKTALTRTGKPIASFLFVGPSGVGKTELAKIVSEFMFGSRDRMIRFDMSEYSDPWSVMRLAGQGYFSDGMLTSAVRREPFCVLLFDEIEKADSSFYDLLLQIIGEGRLSDSQGKLVNFCSAIIIMTSNIGAGKLQGGRIGWKKDIEAKEVSDHFISEVEKNFKPELYNRIDAVVAFEPLSKETVKQVVKREIGLFKKREGIQFRKLDLDIDKQVFEFLAEKGYDAKYGARFLQRVVREQLIVPMAYTLNQFDYDDQLRMHVVIENSEIEFHTTADPMAFDHLMEQWDKLTLADQTSFFRRKMLLVQEGPLYMRLQSELDLMEVEKKSNEEAFWKNIPQSNLYSNLLNVKEKAENLSRKINNLEIEMALAALEQSEYDEATETKIESWSGSFFTLQLSLFHLLFPENSTCYLSIYGPNPLQPLSFYLELIEHKGFEIRSAQAIWYREGFHGIDDDNPLLAASEKLASPFVKRQLTELTSNHIHLNPPKSTDRLYGVEITIYGPASLLYFNFENGIQEWRQNSANEAELFVVNISNEYSDTPIDIVRQQFYTKRKPFRALSPTEIKDGQLGINTQVKPKDQAAFLGNVLDEIFEKEIESQVVQGHV